MRRKHLLIGLAILFGPPLILAGGLILLVLWLIPQECDEGIMEGASVQNTRGDVASEYIKACTSIGTNVDYSIVLKTRGRREFMTLARYDEHIYAYPWLHWANDNALFVQFGRAQPVWSRFDRVGDIRIIYDFSSAQPDR